jgi:hypothetical protein
MRKRLHVRVHLKNEVGTQKKAVFLGNKYVCIHAGTMICPLLYCSFRCPTRLVFHAEVKTQSRVQQQAKVCSTDWDKKQYFHVCVIYGRIFNATEG